MWDFGDHLGNLEQSHVSYKVHKFAGQHGHGKAG